MKKMVILMLAGVMVLSALPTTFAGNQEEVKPNVITGSVGTIISTATTNAVRAVKATPLVTSMEEIEFTFEDFIKSFETGSLSEKQKQELKKLFDQAMKYEKDQKWDEANKVWDDIFKQVEKFLPNEFKLSEAAETDDVFPKTLDDYLAYDKDYLKPMSTTEKANLEKLYKAMLAVNQNDYAALEKVEKAFYEALDKFYDYDKMVEPMVMDEEKMNFDDFLKMFEGQLLPMNVNDKKALQVKYDAAMKLLEDGKYDEYEKAINAFDALMAKHYDYKLIYTDKSVDHMIEGMDLTKAEKEAITKVYNKLMATIKTGKQDNIIKDAKAFEEALSKLYDKYFPVSICTGAFEDGDNVIINGDMDDFFGLENFIQSKNMELKPFSDVDYEAMLKLYDQAMDYKQKSDDKQMNASLEQIVKILSKYKK